MAANSNQQPSSVGDSRQQVFKKYFKFLDNILLYVKAYKDCENPPTVPLERRAFTSDIGRAVLKEMDLKTDSDFEDDLQNVVNSCLFETDEDTQVQLIGEFVSRYSHLLTFDDYGWHLQFFSIICKLCLPFYAQNKENCVSIAIKFGTDYLMAYTDFYKKLDRLDEYAKEFLKFER